MAHDLKNAGIKVWFDAWDILPGHSIPEEIQKALDRSDFVVVLLSHQAISSVWVGKEWQSQVGLEAESRRGPHHSRPPRRLRFDPGTTT